jgi:hypothetical protein
MARKDDIFNSFLEHPIFEDNYNLKRDALPRTLREGLMSKEPIIKVIAMIVDKSEDANSISDPQLRTLVIQTLNEIAL